MTRPELLGLQAFFTVDPDTGAGRFREELQAEFVAHLGEVLPEVLLELSGLEMDGAVMAYTGDSADDEARAQFDEVMTAAYFLPLQMDMAVRIMAASSPPGDPAKVKKSKGTPRP